MLDHKHLGDLFFPPTIPYPKIRVAGMLPVRASPHMV
jgi:hypothetical protein